MKSVELLSGESFFVGPLARLTVNKTITTPEAAKLLAAFSAKRTTQYSSIDNIEARIIEMVYCAEKIVALSAASNPAAPLTIPVSIGAGIYRGMVEAPRGILIHDYTANADGRVTAANLIVATQNNYDAIDTTITGVARHVQPTGNEEELFNGVEFAVRCFDPCLSCATHVGGRMPLTITLRQQGRTLRTITRGDT